MRGAQRLPHPAGVRADHDVGEIEDLRRRPIVHLEPNHGRVRETLVEVDDVADVSAAPSVDGLIVITDHADVAVLSAKELDQLVLRAIRVLILVDEDVLKSAAIALELVRMLLEHANGKYQQVVEVNGIRRLERL